MCMCSLHLIYYVLDLPHNTWELQRAMRTTEAYDNLMRKSVHNAMVVPLLLRELANADSNVHAAHLRVKLDNRDLELRLSETKNQNIGSTLHIQ